MRFLGYFLGFYQFRGYFWCFSINTPFWGYPKKGGFLGFFRKPIFEFFAVFHLFLSSPSKHRPFYLFFDRSETTLYLRFTLRGYWLIFSQFGQNRPKSSRFGMFSILDMTYIRVAAREILYVLKRFRVILLSMRYFLSELLMSASPRICFVKSVLYIHVTVYAIWHFSAWCT